jgi:hypothetical protein
MMKQLSTIFTDRLAKLEDKVDILSKEVARLGGIVEGGRK